MRARPDRVPRRRPRLPRRLPPALLAGVVALLASPVILGAALPQPDLRILSAVATPDPAAVAGEARAAAARAAAARDALALAPDPAGEASSPSRRLAPAVETLTGYQWPLPGARLTLGFGPSGWGSKIVDGERFHDGLDLATFCGDQIVAAHAGTVLAAGRRFDEFIGWLGDLTPYTDRLDAKHLWMTLPIVVVVDDGNGYRSIYAHFRKLVVEAGDVVEAGQLLGYEGATGRASGCHLHYGLFSPDEVATFGFEEGAAARMLLPTELIARVDPLLVLPSLEAGGIR